MSALFQTTWITLVGLSFLFVGGFVLWVYGTQDAPETAAESGTAGNSRSSLVQWFLLYGLAAVFFGAGCLLTAAMMIL